jgi:nitrate/nitrite transporter NarK
LIHRGHDETRTRKTILTISFLSGLLLIAVVYARTATAALVFLTGASLVGLGTGNIFAILQSCAPPGEVGVWTGIENLVGNVGGILAPLVTGFLIAHTGSYVPGFTFAAILLVMGLLAYWIIVGELKPPDEIPV